MKKIKNVENIIFIISVNAMISFFFLTFIVNVFKISVKVAIITIFLGLICYFICKRLTNVLKEEYKIKSNIKRKE